MGPYAYMQTSFWGIAYTFANIARHRFFSLNIFTQPILKDTDWVKITKINWKSIHCLKITTGEKTYFFFLAHTLFSFCFKVWQILWEHCNDCIAVQQLNWKPWPVGRPPFQGQLWHHTLNWRVFFLISGNICFKECQANFNHGEEFLPNKLLIHGQ